MKNKSKFLGGLVLIVALLVVGVFAYTYVFKSLPAINTREVLGNVDGVDIEVIVQSPSAQETPLQIICLFEYVEGDIYNPPALPKESNGLVHVDDALQGLISELRRTYKFEGQFLETLLITPPENTIPAKKLLLIGLGNREKFIPENMIMVGLTGMREALRLGVTNYAHASDLKDAGIDSPTAEVAGNVIQGAIEAFRTQNYLRSQNASDPLTVTKVSLLSGPPYYEDSKTGVRKAINAFNRNIIHSSQ